MRVPSRASLALAALVAVALTIISTAWSPPATAAEFTAIPGEIAGTSPDGLGTWAVHYQRVAGGDPVVADAMNDQIDAEANRLVQQATWDGSTKRPWTFNAAGEMHVGPMTVAEIFTSEYNTDEPNMPMRSVSGVVCDSRSGIRLTWDNLFVDKQAGLIRLGEATEASLSSVAPPEYMRDWRRDALFAPYDINFKAWMPTAAGIELHFPEFQFGRGLKLVTVPWSRVTDLIAPEFRPIMA